MQVLSIKQCCYKVMPGQIWKPKDPWVRCWWRGGWQMWMERAQNSQAAVTGRLGLKEGISLKGKSRMKEDHEVEYRICWSFIIERFTNLKIYTPPSLNLLHTYYFLWHDQTILSLSVVLSSSHVCDNTSCLWVFWTSFWFIVTLPYFCFHLKYSSLSSSQWIIYYWKEC